MDNKYNNKESIIFTQKYFIISLTYSKYSKKHSLLENLIMIKFKKRLKKIQVTQNFIKFSIRTFKKPLTKLANCLFQIREKKLQTAKAYPRNNQIILQF